MTTPGNLFAPVELTCQQLVELVTDYLEEVLSTEERIRFEHHLETCGYCRRHVDQVCRTIHVVGMLRPVPLAAERKQELLNLFRQWNQEGTS